MKISKYRFSIFFLIISSLFGSENPDRALLTSAAQSTLAWTRYAIEGYALPSSVKAGETIKLYVSVCDSGEEHNNYTIKIFRIPDTTNALFSSSVITGKFYYLHDSFGKSLGIGDYSRKPVDFQKGCRQYWDSTAVSVDIPLNWKSGLYYAELEHRSSSVSQKKYYVPFIVRSPRPGSTSNILFKYDFSTSQAYNYWGGGSLYSKTQDSSLTISDTITIDRPMWNELGKTIKFGYANQFIKTLEDSGMAMEYCNNIDIDSLGLPFLSAYKTLVLWAHDEYWTQKERDYTESFIGRNNSHLHNNLARFSANTCYWRTEWLNNAHLQFRCNKWWAGKYYVNLSRFRFIEPTNPEGKFLGSQYQQYYNDVATEAPSDSVVAPTHWIFRGLGLNYGDTLGYGYNHNGRWYGLLANELDNTIQKYGKADYPTTILAKRYVRSHKDNVSTELVLHEMIYYEDTTSNARVFGLGAGALSIALLPYDGNDRAKIQQMIINIMSHFSEQKYIGNIYAPSSYPLVWKSNIRLDGNVKVLQNRKLLLKGTPTVTIDSLLEIDGELDIKGNVTVVGKGSLLINPGGVLRIKSGSTFTVDPSVFYYADDGLVVYESGAKLIVKNTPVKNRANFNLSQNFPNPFNPTTTFRYGVTEKSTVRLTIFNSIGQEVSQAFNGSRDAGYYEDSFDASKYSSGIYFYRIEAVSQENPNHTFVDTRKMILLK